MAAPSVISTISMTRAFEFNVEEYLQCSRTFEWWVGEGPLYWYRIEWKDPICQPNECGSGSTCSISPTECECTPPPASCTSPNSDPCVCTQCQVWTVLATSVEHLCARLNTECCQRPPKGKVFKKIQKWDRPALCCDVQKFIMSNIPMTDQYIDVDFCECECVSWVDPCDCGDIEVPCDHDVPSSPCTASTISSMGFFGMAQMPLSIMAGFTTEQIKIMQPQVDNIITRCDCAPLPSTLEMKHNLTTATMLKEFLSRHKLKMGGDMELNYNKHSDTWQNTQHLIGTNEQWKILTEWSCIEEASGRVWRMHMLTTREQGGKCQKTKVLLNFGQHGTTDSKKMFGMNFSLNTKTHTIASKRPVALVSKVIQDEIGMFRGAWGNELRIAVEGKKG